MPSEKMHISLEVAALDAKRLNEQFIKESIAEWDRDGQGSFKKWIEVKLLMRWLEMARWN